MSMKGDNSAFKSKRREIPRSERNQWVHITVTFAFVTASSVRHSMT